MPVYFGNYPGLGAAPLIAPPAVRKVPDACRAAAAAILGSGSGSLPAACFDTAAGRSCGSTCRGSLQALSRGTRLMPGRGGCRENPYSDVPLDCQKNTQSPDEDPNSGVDDAVRDQQGGARPPPAKPPPFNWLEWLKSPMGMGVVGGGLLLLVIGGAAVMKSSKSKASARLPKEF